MKLTAKLHGIIDYLVVIFLLAAPTLFGLPPTTALFTYILALIHFALTITTDFPPGFIKLIPLKVHGTIELIVSIALAAAAFMFGAMEGAVAQYFYLSFAAAVFLTWLLTDYNNAGNHH